VWNDWNIDHIAEHDVEPFEAEEVGDNPSYLERRGDRYLAWGSTGDGRFLLVVYVRKPGSRYVISARDMEEREKRRLRRLTRR
jgi:hypothetical protein